MGAAGAGAGRLLAGAMWRHTPLRSNPLVLRSAGMLRQRKGAVCWGLERTGRGQVVSANTVGQKAFKAAYKEGYA